MIFRNYTTFIPVCVMTIKYTTKDGVNLIEHEGTQTLDNGICAMMHCAIALAEGNAKEAELHLLSAKNILNVLITIDFKFGHHESYIETILLNLFLIFRFIQNIIN